MKIYGLLLLSIVSACSAESTEFCAVNKQGVAQAYAELAKKIDGLELRRRRVTWCAGTAAAVLSAWAVYKWLKPSENHAILRPFDGLRAQDARFWQAQDARWGVAERHLGFFSRTRDAFTGGIVSAVSYMPTLAAGVLVNAAAQVAATRAMHFYRPFDWHWLSNEYTHIRVYMGQLKVLAAALDPHSALFDSIKHITINVDQTAGIQDDTQVVSMPALDELVRLAAQARDAGQKDVVSEDNIDRLMLAWESLVQALQYHIAFIQYRAQQYPDASMFDKKQVLYFERDVYAQTNALAKRLPTMLNNMRNEQKHQSGLLVAVYEYCCCMTYLLDSLDVNEIVQG